MGLVETEAIVLHTHKLADADKIVVSLTERAGLVRGVARGARRLKSRFGASLEPFTLINLTFFEKETRELVTIKNAEIIRSYFGAAGDSDTVAALEQLVELVREFAPPHQADERLFRMLRACIEALAGGVDPAPVFTYCELWVLRLTGFLPDMRTCGGCGRRLREASAEEIYVTQEGLLWCRECRSGGARVLKRGTYELLYVARSLKPGEWASEYSSSPSETRQNASDIARGLVRRALEAEPRAGRFAKSPTV
ncbi:MAG TPA: DNA repair protein RecO [Pyrinomonadaceae bacterium]|jgi:DNA repair protein RecO (recombination protein O)|nr:DNA repair protein RecO [Pyrinomonadaceae bacterium]